MMKTATLLEDLGIKPETAFYSFFTNQDFMTPALEKLGTLDVEVLQEEKPREVYLHIDNQACLFGRTLIPQETMRAIPELEHLKTTSLGKLLEKYQATRQALTYVELDKDDELSQAATQKIEHAPSTLLARYSVFNFNSVSLTVYEVALPALLERLATPFSSSP